MRLLLDENLPHDLAELLTGHTATTVSGKGWSGIENGELLRRASEEFDVLLTMDRRLPAQQHVAGLKLGVLLIQAPSNRMGDLKPLIGQILAALPSVRSGTVVSVGA